MGIVLIIDDSSTEREILSGCLRQGGFTVFTANSGEEALEKLGNGTYQPDLIVLDVVLPGQSGFEVCRILKAQTATAPIPVILCSTKGTDMDKFWGKKQGADEYLPKPVDQEQLLKSATHLTKK
ncbi:response regulator [Prochlorothrix hollandica]|uniref:Chemotaxis protein CheY n=1 Tax=Prochlorothrix hollandica PCC 9006 = CALU 1027 TaxID=317619 RepID=A0A0M2Q0Z8_PROHO|nr:response regulator [Prochlorothrix hollandica]KKJ00634.1 chemotaxis protein CheY [Prochlorothrix hollandica PCC 9006 = CALU 1027]